jgi:Tfp pilus assembly protein FimT
MKKPARNGNQKGFTLIEVAMGATILIIVAGFAVPTFLSIRNTMRLSGDNSSIAGLVVEAKMRAAANFTHARVYADLSASTYRLEIWNKTGGAGGTGCWQTDGDTVNACTTASSARQKLSPGVSFGFGNVASPPTNTQTTIGLAPLCYTGVAGQAGNTVTTAQTSCIEFNSRGIPSNPASNGVADATGAFYVTDGKTVYGITVLAAAATESWFATNTSAATWKRR